MRLWFIVVSQGSMGLPLSSRASGTISWVAETCRCHGTTTSAAGGRAAGRRRTASAAAGTARARTATSCRRRPAPCACGQDAPAKQTRARAEPSLPDPTTQKRKHMASQSHLDVVPLHQPVDVRRPVELRGAVVAGAHLHRRGAAVRRRVQAEPAAVAERHPPDVRPPAALHGGNVRHVQLLHAALVHADVRRRLAVRVALEGAPPVPSDVAQGPLGAEHDAYPGKGREVGLGVHLVVENHVA